MTYREFLPCPALAPHVTRIWCWDEPPAGVQTRRVLPDGCIELVINCGSQQRKAPADGEALEEQPSAFVAGQLTRYIDLVRADRIDVVGVRFRTDGFARFTGLPADEFTDRDIALGDLWGIELEERVREARGPIARKVAIEAYLMRRLPAATDRDAVVAAAVDRLADGGTTDIGTLSAALGISTRQLQRRFRTATGLTPKQYASIRRLQRVVRILGLAPERELTALAQDAGFYDQPHFIHEVRRMAGIRPSQLRRSSSDEGGAEGEVSPFYNLAPTGRVVSPPTRRHKR